MKNVKITAVTTATRMGTGISPNTSPPMVLENEAGRLETARASVMMYTRLRRMACVPSVMTKGGRPVAVTRKPFTMPMAAPNTSTPRKMASSGSVSYTHLVRICRNGGNRFMPIAESAAPKGRSAHRRRQKEMWIRDSR